MNDEDDDKVLYPAGRVLVCTFDPWHTVRRFERRLARLWKRLPLGEDSRILMMSDGLPLCAECKMVMEQIAVPEGASAVTAHRLIAEDFAGAMKRTREG